MGIEPTNPSLARRFIGFEDRGRHQSGTRFRVRSYHPTYRTVHASRDDGVRWDRVELANEHFRLLVESVQDYAIYLLGPDGTVRSWNAGAQRLKGYEASEIVGHNFDVFFLPEHRAAGEPAALLATALRDGRAEEVSWRVRKDGSQFWARAIITTLRDRDGAHLGFAKVTHDLTDRGYRAFVEATHAIVWTTDANGRPNADSPSWREFTGQSEAEWHGLRGWDPLHPDDLDAMRTAWPRAKQNRTRFEAEFRLRRHTGEYVWMAARAIPFFDADGQVREWFGVTFDISDRKRAEQATARALELLSTTLQSIGDAVISTDLGGVVQFMNPIAEQLTGWSAAEARGRRLHDVFAIFNEETRLAVENPVDKVLRQGVIVGLANHTMLRRRDGSEVPIDDSAAPIKDPDGTIHGVVLVFRDATEEKRALLRRSFLAQATEELIVATDYRDALARVAQLAVPRLADWVGVDIAAPGSAITQQLAVAHVDPAKAELARELARRFPPDPDARTGVPAVMRTGRSELYPEIPREQLEAAGYDPERLQILSELDLRSAMVVPLRGKSAVFGAITFIFAGAHRRYTQADLDLAEDLARRAALIIERRRLEEEAERANRMKDDFLATMSHELRTPLQAIVGYAALLERGSTLDPAKSIAAIKRNADAQARLIEDILDVSRITTGKLRLTMARVDLAGTIRAALESMRPAASAKRIRIVESLPADLGTVQGDYERLQQIVWNLVSNAVKFTGPEGTIEIRATRTGSSVRLVVCDTGIGIGAEHLSTIFERFRQIDSSTTRQRGGLGLGLAVVRYLVEAHGGTVRADSEGVGKGATLTVTLPIVSDVFEAASVERAAGAGDERPLRGIRIVVVEDDDDARLLLGEVLAGAGAAVRLAASAQEGFETIRDDPPHVLICDIGMPMEDGFSLLRRVRALPPEHGGDVPAIALTAYARPEDARATADAGFQMHLVKPVSPEAILEAVRAWRRR
jgi:PAS domain S-box-containing protein